jgi:CRISPR-associated RAMP protein, csm4 family
MPFIGDTYYIPKPLVKIQTESQGNSKLKKAFKKLSYISSDKLEVYLKGQLDAEKENEKFSNLGVSTVRTSVAVSNLDKPSPYRVGVFNFNEGNGLYVIVGYEDDNLLYLVSDLLESLSFSGLGGHRSSGLGRFEYKFVKEEFIQTILKRLNDNSKVKTSLSVALPTEEELPTVIENSRYKMLKRSGFVASTTYIKEEDKKDNSMLYFRKNDLYVFSAGSTFTKDFLGDVYDVSNNGRHLVYRYAKPMLMGVDL